MDIPTDPHHHQLPALPCLSPPNPASSVVQRVTTSAQDDRVKHALMVLSRRSNDGMVNAAGMSDGMRVGTQSD